MRGKMSIICDVNIAHDELYVSLRPVDDTLTRETRRVRVGVYASVSVFASDPKSWRHKSRCTPQFQVEPRASKQRHQTPSACFLMWYRRTRYVFCDLRDLPGCCNPMSVHSLFYAWQPREP
jgi:hypothetical protein